MGDAFWATEYANCIRNTTHESARVADEDTLDSMVATIDDARSVIDAIVHVTAPQDDRLTGWMR